MTITAAEAARLYEDSLEDPTVPAAPVETEAEPAEVEIARFESMTHADRVAVLSALRDAIDERVAIEKAHITENLLGATENVSVPTAGYGSLSYRAPKQTVKVDEGLLLAYVKQVAPEAVTTVTQEVIDPELHERLAKDLVHVGDGLFARVSTGETVEYAFLSEPSKPSVAWSASREQKRAKANARRILGDYLPAMTEPLDRDFPAGEIDG